MVAGYIMDAAVLVGRFLRRGPPVDDHQSTSLCYPRRQCTRQIH